VHAAAKGDTPEIAIKVVDPIVIRAGQLRHTSCGLIADHRTLVGAAVTTALMLLSSRRNTMTGVSPT
jgi:hypothetical protein